MDESTVESTAGVFVDLTEKMPIRVLHLDSDPGFLKVAKLCLELQGPFKVDTASSIEDAIEKMKKKSYDVIISDYVMPEKSGLEFLKELRDSGNKIPFIMFTGKGREEVVIKALNLGADQYVDKTGDPETVYCQLAHSIRTAVEGKKTEEALRKSEEKWRSLAKNAPNIIIIADRNGTIQFINRTVIGVSPEKVVGKSIYDFIDPENHETVRKTIEHVFRTGEGGRYETPGSGPDGNVSWYETHVGAIKRNGQIISVTLISTDVTERKKTEEKLKESEKKFRLIFEGARDGILAANAKTKKFVFANPRIREITGYSEKELLRLGVEDIHPKKDLSYVIDTFAKQLQRKIEIGRDIPVLRKDRNVIYCDINSYLLEVGERKLLVGLFRDVTERKKAEEKLKESEEKYKNLFENARNVTLTLDFKGNVTSINKAAVEYGFKKDEMIGKNMLKFVPKKYWPKLLKELVHITQGKTVEDEIEIITPKGKKIATYRSNPIIIGNKIVGIQVILEDITEHKQTEEAMQESEERFKTLVEEAPISIFNTDLMGKITYANKKFEEATGYSREEIVGKNSFKLGIMSDETLKLLAERMKKRLIGKPSRLLEGRFKRKDGEWIWAEIEGRLIKKFGVPVGFQLTARDITERKRTEKAIRESQEKFEQLFMSNPEAAVYADSDFHVLDANSRFSELFGYSLDEIKGKQISDLIVPEDKKEEGQTLDKEAKKTFVYYDTVRKKKDGTLVPVSISAAPITIEGQPVGYVGMYKDITERKHFEERLSTLHTYSRDLNIAESREEIYRLTLDAMEKTLGFEIAFFMIVNKDMLCVADHRGYPEAFSIKLPLDGTKRGVSVKVAQTGRSINVPDAEKEDAWVEFMPGIRSALDVPVKVGSKVLGVLGVDSKKLNAFNEKDQELLEILASHAATALSNLDRAKNLEAYAKEVRESQEKFERLFIDNPEAAVYVDSDFHILDANPHFSELFGYSLDEIKGKFINDVVVPKDKIEEAEMLNQNALKGCVYYDSIRKRKDGSLVPVSISAASIIVEGKLIGAVGLYRDITERKHYEESLSALNIYGRKLNTAESKEEIYRLTLDAMQTVLGFEYADFFMIDKSMLCIVDQSGYLEPFPLELPLDGSKKGISLKAVKTGNSVLVQDVRKDIDFVEGLPGVLSELAVPIKVGQKVLGVLNVESKKLSAFTEKDQELLEILAAHAATAISNLEYAESLETYAKEIRESQQKFERLFMNNPEAADYLDPTFHIIDVNPRFTELFGYSLDEVKGKHINDVIVPKGKMEEAKILDEESEKTFTYHDTVRRRKDGSLVPVSISAAPIIVEGNLIGSVGLYKDISDLKKAEGELKATLNKLGLMNEKLRVVGGLTRHDVRNKLSAITMNIYLAKSRLAMDDKALERLNEIEPIVRNVERIFDFARTYEMIGIEELVYIDVNKTFEEAVSLFSDLKGVEIVNNCSGLTVLADSLLRQFFYNLIDNSLKYGEKITQIRIYFEKTEDDKLKLIYEDDGVGIPEKMRSNLFKEGVGKGTGYGLYMIKKICETYGWTIQETGKPRKGVQFIITIPKMSKDGKENYRIP
jgi:PAS domain S-box-containing protein